MPESQAILTSVPVSSDIIERARVSSVTTALVQVFEKYVEQLRKSITSRQLHKRIIIEARCHVELPPDRGLYSYSQIVRLVVRKARRVEVDTSKALGDEVVAELVAAYKNMINVRELKRSVFLRDPFHFAIVRIDPETKNTYECIRTEDAILAISLKPESINTGGR